jgi:pimeloyl-ACP methyl ester carboxylesterase
MRTLRWAAETEQTLRVVLGGIPRVVRGTHQQQGLGVLLVPGFGATDHSFAITAEWLRTRGYRPAPARIGFNVGCTTELVTRIERRLEEHADRTGRRVVLLGQSRGGWLARPAASRRPDLTRALVTLGSPVLDPMGAHPHVMRAAKALARLSALGVPGLVDEDCFTGACYDRNTAELARELPASVPAMAVYSGLDRIAPWQLCQDPWADCVEVRSSHTAMGLHPDFYRALRPRLAEWATEDSCA